MEELDDSEKDKLAVPLAVVEEVRGIKGSYRPPLKVAVKLDTQDVCMNLDTEASVSILVKSQTKNKQLKSIPNQVTNLLKGTSGSSWESGCPGVL